MHLKLFVLSASSVMLWLAPAALDKTAAIHKALQGVSLTAAIACAVTAGNIARKQAEQNEIEEIKTRAITADVVDEIATSAYISQQQRQQEAELILASPGDNVEATREALEAIYSQSLQDDTSTSEHPDYPIYLEICKSREAGKSTTWIVENVLKMGGRKFSDGKVKYPCLELAIDTARSKYRLKDTNAVSISSGERDRTTSVTPKQAPYPTTAQSW